jgi:putative transposase
MIDQEQDSGEVELSAADEQVLRELTERARTGGLRLTGEGGLLGRLTKMVIEGALEGELDDHLGYEKNDPAGRDGGNSRNGYRAKTLLTEAGPVEISVPRDRDSTFEPRIVAKRQRRLTGVDDMVISLSAKGLTHGEISAHLAEVYGADVSKQTISAITDRVMEGMADWQGRLLDSVYAVIFIDAIQVKIREGQVANRPVYLALGVTADGEREILGLWAGEHGDGEGAKYWLRVLTEIKNRGVQDVCMVVCDGLKGLPDAVSAVWEKTIVQACIVHLLRNTFKYASKKYWAQVAKDIKPVYTAASEAEALDRFAEFGRIRAIPAIRPRDPHRHLHHQRDRVDQRPAPPRRERPRPLPHRAGRPQVPLPGDHEPGPHRQGPQAVDQPVEGRPQRLRHHLRRPPQRGTQVTTEKEVTPFT